MTWAVEPSEDGGSKLTVTSALIPGSQDRGRVLGRGRVHRVGAQDVPRDGAAARSGLRRIEGPRIGRSEASGYGPSPHPVRPSWRMHHRGTGHVRVTLTCERTGTILSRNIPRHPDPGRTPVATSRPSARDRRHSPRCPSRAGRARPYRPRASGEEGSSAMIPGQFDYVRPANLDEALRILKDREGEAKLLSGGYSLIPLIKLRLAQPALLVDLRDVDRPRRHHRDRRRARHRRQGDPSPDPRERDRRRPLPAARTTSPAGSATRRSATGARSAARSPTPTRPRTGRPSCSPRTLASSAAAGPASGSSTPATSSSTPSRRPSSRPRS